VKVALDHVGQPEREATFSGAEFKEWWVKGEVLISALAKKNNLFYQTQVR